VPRSVVTCRCGANLPPEQPGASGDDSQQHKSPLLAVGVVTLLVLAAAAYWMFVRPGDPTPVIGASPSVAGAGAAPAGQPGASAPSLESRAWNLQAQLEESRNREPATKDPSNRQGATEEPVAPPANTNTGLTPALEDMVDRAMPAIVLVEATSGRGSAFFVRHDTLITNVHVVQNDGYVTLRRMDGSSLNARVHSRAPAFDIAVLKVATPSPSQPFLTMGSAQSLKPGQEVVVIGSALGTLQNSVSRGIVSGLRQSGGVTLVQSDAAANPGNSGGPMLDRSGQVVGVLTAGYRGQQGLNFAVSIDHARDILEGRQAASSGSIQTGLSNIQTANPSISESDRRQQQGEQQFLQRVASAEQAAQQLDEAWARFRSVCFKTPITGSHDREWFAVFTQAVPGDAAAGCVDYFTSMRTEMNRFREYMRTAVNDARRASVLPGTIRDALRAKRLNFDWDR
jgi:S1-C subfamily serine protease